jgi:hypothetical protein
MTNLQIQGKVTNSGRSGHMLRSKTNKSLIIFGQIFFKTGASVPKYFSNYASKEKHPT